MSVQLERVSWTPQLYRVMAGVMVSLFVAAMDSTVVGTALPTIARDLGSFQLYPWIVAGYLITATTTVPLWGRLADLHGRDRGVRRRFRALRDQLLHDLAHRLSHPSGDRGWLYSAHRVHHPRRHFSAQAARSSVGPLQQHVGNCRDHRACPWRSLRFDHWLALDLPHQSPPRCGRGCARVGLHGTPTQEGRHTPA